MSMSKMYLKLAVLLLSFGQILYAQRNDVCLLSFEGNAYRLNDEMQVLEIEKPNDLWDLTEIRLLKKNTLRIKQYQPDTLSLVFKGKRAYLTQMEDKVFLVGKESPLYIVDYVRPEQLLAFPFYCNDSICGYFVGYGKYCAEVSVVELGMYQTKVMEQNTLQLPNGESLDNAYLLQTARNVQIQYTSIGDTINPQSKLSVDSISIHLKGTENFIKEQVSRIYAQGYRYPILELVEQRNADNLLLSQHCYYISPELQETIGLDAYNDTIRKLLVEKNNDVLEKQMEQSSFSRKPYHFFYDSETFRVVLRNIQVSEPEVMLIVSDIRGMVYKQQTARLPSDNVSIDCSGLESNRYILFIKVGAATYVEKFKKN